MTSSTNTKKGKRSAKRIVGIVVSAVLVAALVAVVVAANTVLPKFNQIINSYFGVEQSWDNSGVDTSGLDSPTTRPTTTAAPSPRPRRPWTRTSPARATCF